MREVKTRSDPTIASPPTFSGKCLTGHRASAMPAAASATGPQPQGRSIIVIATHSRLRADLFIGLLLRGGGAISSFALAWMLAQIFGARVVGLYQIGFTTATLFAAVAVLGQDVLLVRQIAPLVVDARLAEASARFRGIRRFVLAAGLTLGACCAALAGPLSEQVLEDGAIAPFIIVFAPAVVLLGLMRVQNALLRSLGSVWLSQSLEGISYTTFAMAGMAVIWLVASDPHPLAAPVLVLAGLSISVASGAIFCGQRLAQWPSDQKPVRADARAGAWIAAAPILGQAGNWLILLLITGLIDASAGGVFRVALLICTLMQLINTSFATMVGPHLSRAANAGDQTELRKIVRLAGLIGILLAAPLGIIALALPGWIMGLFGPEFVSGAAALRFLAIGQLINVLAGPVGVALIMLGHERKVLAVEAAATLSGLAAALLLLPQWGLAGAGAGLMLTDLVRNGANWLLVQSASRKLTATGTA